MDESPCFELLSLKEGSERGLLGTLRTPPWSVLQFEIRYKQGKTGETQKAAPTDTKKTS